MSRTHVVFAALIASGLGLSTAYAGHLSSFSGKGTLSAGKEFTAKGTFSEASALASNSATANAKLKTFAKGDSIFSNETSNFAGKISPADASKYSVKPKTDLLSTGLDARSAVVGK